MKKYIFFVLVLSLILSPNFTNAAGLGHGIRGWFSRPASTTPATTTASSTPNRGPKKEVLRLMIGHVVERYDFFLNHFDNLINRIQNHITKIGTNSTSTDTTAAQAKLDEAKAALADAKTKVNALKAQLETAYQAASPKEALMAIKAAAKEAKDALKNVQTKILDTIHLLKS